MLKTEGALSFKVLIEMVNGQSKLCQVDALVRISELPSRDLTPMEEVENDFAGLMGASERAVFNAVPAHI